MAPTSKMEVYIDLQVNNQGAKTYLSSTYLTNHMLKSANPPPGAIEQTGNK